MQIEAPQVLLNHRLAFWNTYKDKEWWYTGVHDPENQLYISLSFLRINFIDSFRLVFFLPNELRPIEWSILGLIEKPYAQEGTRLILQKGNYSVSYVGSAEAGWQFVFTDSNTVISLNIKTTTPVFTKFDNTFIHHYGLMHFFHNHVEGKIRHQEKNYTISNGLGYYDHCFGRVPRSTRWHWIAVQNEQVAIASLLNYGVSPQCYTEIFVRNRDFANCNRWIRLAQEVSFENITMDPYSKKWDITSPDVDLKLTLIGASASHTQIPPIIPIITNLDHYEHFVCVEGKVRIDSVWIDTGKLFGVFEQHSGWW